RSPSPTMPGVRTTSGVVGEGGRVSTSAWYRLLMSSTSLTWDLGAAAAAAAVASSRKGKGSGGRECPGMKGRWGGGCFFCNCFSDSDGLIHVKDPLWISNEPQTAFRDRNDMIWEFVDRDDTARQV